MSAAQRVRPYLGQAPVQNLAFGHQVLDRPRDVLDRDLRIDPMLVEEVDVVGPKVLQHPLDGQLDVGRAAVESGATLAGLEVDVPAELGGDHDLVSKGRHALTENALDLMRAVRLGCIEEGDAPVEGGPDDVDHLGSVRDRRLVGAAHVLDAEPDAGDLQRAQSSPPACLRCRLPARRRRPRRGLGGVPPRSGTAARAPADGRKERRPVSFFLGSDAMCSPLDPRRLSRSRRSLVGL